MNKLTNGKIAVGAPYSLARQAQADSFIKFNDAGHGWLEVPEKLILKLGIVDKISGYSYQFDSSDKKVYLEEDCDAQVFKKAYEEANGCYPVIISKWEDGRSFIRDLKPYMPTHRGDL